jgi:ubiquinone biosynthesis protein COQ4
MKNEALPYLAKGMRDVPTESSVLVSSSKYLNNARLRDWVATHFLRRNGHDRPTPSDNVELKKALAEVRDADHVEALFERERRTNPALDRWLSERFMSSFTADDLKQYGPDTLGGIFYRDVASRGFDYNLEADRAPKSHYEFFWARHLQTHDLEHIVCGGAFDQMGEIVVHWVNLTNYFEHLGADLASEMANKLLFGGVRFVMRAMLHYPETWQVATLAMMRGMRVGKASGPLFMARYESLLHLPLAEVREKLGVRDLGPDFETAAASRIFTEGL